MSAGGNRGSAGLDAVFSHRTLDELTIDDESSFRHVALYGDLKEVLRRAQYRFRVMPAGASLRWDRALLLNLTFWGADQGGDILVDDHIAADTVAHVAWHHLAARALFDRDVPPSNEALFLGESIASAFDVYLVGRLLGHAPQSTFLETQVPAMAAAAEAAGLPEEDFETLLRGVARDPDSAFEELRQLLMDATGALMTCNGADDALASLSLLDRHRFAPLLHRYELSNWVLYARAHSRVDAARAAPIDARAREVDRALRGERSAIDWLASHWVAPALRT